MRRRLHHGARERQTEDGQHGLGDPPHRKAARMNDRAANEDQQDESAESDSLGSGLDPGPDNGAGKGVSRAMRRISS